MGDLKCLAAEAAARYIEKYIEENDDLKKKGVVLGIGTGSTARIVLEKLVGIPSIKAAVPTSFDAKNQILSHRSLRLSSLDEHPQIDILFDGADEIVIEDDCAFMIKGRGGAMFMEKVVAEAAKLRIYVVDGSKISRKMGEKKVPVPIEVAPFAVRSVQRKLESSGFKTTPRSGTGKDGPVVTDSGNLILDMELSINFDAEKCSSLLDSISGIIEHGLFCHHADVVIVGYEEGVKIVKLKQK